MQVAAAHARSTARLTQELEDVAGALGARRRQQARHRGLRNRAAFSNSAVNGAQGIGVLARDARDLLVGDRIVVGQQDRAAVGREGGELGVEGDRVVAEVVSSRSATTFGWSIETT